jgi:hypothetical protein
VSALAYVLALAGSGQGGHVQASGSETVLLALVIAALMAACVVIAVLLTRQHRPQRPVNDQWQALTVMGELCPHGWQAQLTLYGWGAPAPADAPPARAPLVELEWKRFDEEAGQVATARRIWAPTISDALQGMVDDLRTEMTIEQLEQAIADGDDASASD